MIRIYSGNCYAFPSTIVDALRTITHQLNKLGVTKEVNLVSGISKSISTRVYEIAELVVKCDADIVAFQELWGNANKLEIIDWLKDHYTDFAWRSFNSLQSPSEFAKDFVTWAKHPSSENFSALSPVNLDSGLLIASKLPILHKQFVTFVDRAGDEINARKGGIIIHVQVDKQDLIYVTTHLQSWRGAEYVGIRDSQLTQLGQAIVKAKQDWKLADNAPVVLTGDLNDPTCLQKADRRIVDHTSHLVKSLQDAKVDVNNDQVLNLLKRLYLTEEYLEVLVTKGIGILSRAGEQKTLTSQDSPLIAPFNETFEGKDLFDVYDKSDDPKKIQLLDQIFLSPSVKLLQHNVLRKEALGDDGSTMFNSLTAISDHAPLVCVIQLS